MSKLLINILRPNRLFSRSLPLYRKKESTSDEECAKQDDEMEGKEGEEGEGGGEGEGVGIDINSTRRISIRERRRYRTTNIFVPDFTGEKPLHAWFDAKRFKALGNVYEQIRNTHRFTLKVDPKDKKTIGKKLVELSEWKVITIFFSGGQWKKV